MEEKQKLTSEQLHSITGGMNKAQLVDAIAAEANITPPDPPPPPSK